MPVAGIQKRDSSDSRATYGTAEWLLGGPAAWKGVDDDVEVVDASLSMAATESDSPSPMKGLVVVMSTAELAWKTRL